ncbi:MAG: SPFH domain-containing protein [Phycisphaerae bacterium]
MISERERIPTNGWVALLALLAASLGVIAGCVKSIYDAAHLPLHAPQLQAGLTVAGWLLAALLTAIAWRGLFALQPNEAAVLILFGEYRGSARRPGLHYANPFYIRKRVLLRARNLNCEKLKVNDQRGNPIEIAAVVVWRVRDTARAVFDVEDYVNYVKIQSESALRHLASAYPYDSPEDHQVSLRGRSEEVARALCTELQERLGKAGVEIDEAYLSHLAYAPEIAGAMLRRQQAEAIIAARTRIVEGAVGMVRMALDHLEHEKVVELDGERRAAMVSNLLVVLCGEQAAQPVLNAGTLYG